MSPWTYAVALKDRSIRRHYVLPDGVSSAVGYVKETDPLPPLPAHITVRPEEQILTMAQERLVPEILFSPGDIGLRQAGIPEAIVQAVNETPEDLRPRTYTRCFTHVSSSREATLVFPASKSVWSETFVRSFLLSMLSMCFCLQSALASLVASRASD